MGNVPSKEPQGRLPSNKLSKPRAVSSSSTATANPSNTAAALLPSPSNGLSANPLHALDKPHHLITIPYSETASSESPDDNDDDDNDLRPNGDSDKSSFLIPNKVQRRLSLFRSKSSQEASELRKSRRNTIIGSPNLASSTDGAIVRANSVSTHPVISETPRHLVRSTTERLPPARTRASWAYDLSSYEAQRILNIVRDQPTPLPRSQTSTSLLELDTEHLRARASRRVSLPIQPESAPITRSNSEMSLHPPMRRRSLIQTPGVATRTRPSPSSAKAGKSSFRHSHPPTPSISRQSSFAVNDGRYLSLPPILPPSNNDMQPLCRVLTPKDTDYSTTGAFKLGTLRITNGSPELTPNVVAALQVVDEQGTSNVNQGDYFSKGPSSEPTNANFASLSQFSSELGKCQNPGVSVPELGEPILESSPPSLSITVPNQELNGLYASELQLSPDETSQGPSSSPKFKTQSRQAAVDDHLFDDDDLPEISVVEVLDVRIDSSAKSPPRYALETTQLESQGVQRTDSGFVSNSKSESSQSHSSLAKADSGYSSNVSLRSLRSGRKPATSERESGSSLDGDGVVHKVQDQPLSTTTDETIVELPRLEKAPTPPPKDDALMMKLAPKPPARESLDGDVPTMTAAPSKVRRKSVRHKAANIDTFQTGDSGNKPTDATSPTTASVNSETSSSSSLSIGNNAQKPGRLQRLLSLRGSTFSKHTLTVHATHAVDNNRVPSIPKDVEEKLREHTGLFPMTTKRLALKNQISKETLKTILSVGSLELTRDDEVHSTDTSSSAKQEQYTETSDVGDAKESSLKNTFNSMQSNFRHAAISVVSSRKSTSRKPVPPREESQTTPVGLVGKDDAMLATEAELTSYQAINSTLGSNAYDVAALALHSPVQNQPNSLDSGRSPATSTSDGNPSLQKHRSSRPPVSMATRGSFRSPPARSPLNPQGPAVLHAKSRVESSQHASASSEQYIAYRGSEGLRRGRSASGFQYRAASCGPATRRISVNSYQTSPASSRHNSISSVQSDFNRGLRDGYSNAQNPTGLNLKRQTSLDGFNRNQMNVHLAQPAHRGPANRPGWNPQNSSHNAGGQYWDQQAWLPPYVPRDAHRRNLSAGSRPLNQGAGQAPYRILHSYNSPAYRNAPIWG